jgi:large subunit ribosomal protein L34
MQLNNRNRERAEKNMPKRTYQPKTKQTKREHGFMKRMNSKNGKNVIKRRKAKGREKITA